MSIMQLCRAAGLPRSDYYYYANSKKDASKDDEVIGLICRLPEPVRLYGGNKTKSQKIKQLFGITINHKRMGRICRTNNFLARNRRKRFPDNYYRTLAENRSNLPDNRLNRNFHSAEPSRKLCTDVSYFRTQKDWLYFSPVMDLYNRKIIAYAISDRNNQDLITETIKNLLKQGEFRGAVLHSDQGCLYRTNSYKRQLSEAGITQSMSRKGNCWDNACMEHFFSTVKIESGYNAKLKTNPATYRQTKKLIEKFVEFYNNERISKQLNWGAPSQFSLKTVQ